MMIFYCFFISGFMLAVGFLYPCDIDFLLVIRSFVCWVSSLAVDCSFVGGFFEKRMRFYFYFTW